jgi:hypothetical protein
MLVASQFPTGPLTILLLLLTLVVGGFLGRSKRRRVRPER